MRNKTTTQGNGSFHLAPESLTLGKAQEILRAKSFANDLGLVTRFHRASSILRCRMSSDSSELLTDVTDRDFALLAVALSTRSPAGQPGLNGECFCTLQLQHFALV
ncbi:MAG: hypothetical protein II336_20575 [Loktanella sp.]|nr:hypothetical protein [Loktanella sp.]